MSLKRAIFSSLFLVALCISARAQENEVGLRYAALFTTVPKASVGTEWFKFNM